MVLVKFLSFYLGIWRFLQPNGCISCTRGSLIMVSMEGEPYRPFFLRNLFPKFRPCDDKLGNSCFQIFKQSRVNEWIILSWIKEHFSREYHVVCILKTNTLKSWKGLFYFKKTIFEDICTRQKIQICTLPWSTTLTFAQAAALSTVCVHPCCSTSRVAFVQ